MGTKSNPGDFDCYFNADPDEPMFILLGRDRHAPELVRLWAHKRRMQGESPEKIAEAEACADAMDKWRVELHHGSPEAVEAAARKWFADWMVCPACEGLGWFAANYRNDEPEQVQCHPCLGTGMRIFEDYAALHDAIHRSSTR